MNTPDEALKILFYPRPPPFPVFYSTNTATIDIRLLQQWQVYEHASCTLFYCGCFSMSRKAAPEPLFQAYYAIECRRRTVPMSSTLGILCACVCVCVCLVKQRVNPYTVQISPTYVTHTFLASSSLPCGAPMALSKLLSEA